VIAWTLEFNGFDAALEGLREALCTLGNGYVATRGAAPEHPAGGVHYPGTYAAGIYNRLRDTVAGETVENESLVNLPNWLPLTFRAEAGPWLGQAGVEVLDEWRGLDLRRGVLTRRLRVRDSEGRVTAVTQRRFVHLRHEHVCGLQTTLAAENWSGTLTVRSELDAAVANAGVARYRGLSGRHLVPRCAEPVGAEAVRCVVETNQSHVRVAQAARTRLFRAGRAVDVTREVVREPGRIGHELRVGVAAGEQVTVEKLVTIFTSRDAASSDPGAEAVARLAWLADFDAVLEEHVLAWRQLWRRFHIWLEGAQSRALPAVRLHLFHLLQSVSGNSVDLDVGVPARGLHGEAYRGHVLWDELFVLPILLVSGDTVRVAAGPGRQPPIRLCCRGETVLLGPGEAVELPTSG
jgi:trehalose 6-phosphate phosphatase